MTIPVIRVELAGVAEAVEYEVNGVLVRGTFYRPSGAHGPLPVIVLAHGWAMVAGGDLEEYAATMVNAGFAALTFDFRNLGASEGAPRQELDPHQQIDDFRAAISYVRSRPEVDRERIGIWGSSYAGGHALTVAAIDKRVRCVVAQVPSIDGYAAGLRRVRHDKASERRMRFNADREARFAGSEPTTLPIVSDDPDAAVVYPGRDSFDYMIEESKRCPTWVNAVTLKSLEMAQEYSPGDFIRRIGPTPLLMIIADNDGLTPTDLQQDAFNQAHHPKKLILVSGGHYSVYRENFDTTRRAAADWFVEHLRSDPLQLASVADEGHSRGVRRLPSAEPAG